MGKPEYVPQRGDLVWICPNGEALSPESSRQQAVVLSPESYNRRIGLAVFCPVTDDEKGYPFEVVIPQDSAGTGVVLADQLECLDWRLANVESIGPLPSETINFVLQKARVLLTQ